MRLISKLEQQKRHPDRVNVYLDGEFAFGLHKEVAHKFSLRKGMQIGDDLLKKLTHEEEFSVAKRKALKYLERRMRSEHEVRSKLRDAGFPDQIIEPVVQYLEKINCLDDKLYATALKNDLQKRRSAGRQLVKLTLKKRGISDEIAKSVMEGISELEDEATARELAGKLLRKYGSSRKAVPPDARIRRMSQALSRRGFSWSVISKVIKQTTNKQYSED